MTYNEFINLRRQEKVSAGINTSIALRLVNQLPKNYQYAHLFWSWVWILSIPAFILVAIFYKWWIGLLLLFFMSPLLFSSTKKSATKFVLEHAEGNQAFFEYLVDNNLLMFKSTP